MAATAKRDSMEATTPDLSSKLKHTHIDDKTASSTSTHPSFATIGSTIRDKIYAHVLDTELVNVGAENVSYTHNIQDGVLQYKASRPPFPVSTALFYVNKEIGREALRYFYSKNLFVRFELYSSDARHAKTMLSDSGVLFSVADPQKVSQCKQHAMDLTLVEKNSSQKRAAVIFPAQYLPRLINFLDQASRAASSWAPSHALFANILNTYGFALARLQGDLLELFRLLTNVGGVTIDPTNLLPTYAEGLQESMMAAEFVASRFLEMVIALMDRADAAREAKEWELGAQLAQSCIIALTYGYLTRAEALHSESEEFVKEVQRVRWRAEIGVAKALLSLHEPHVGDGDWASSTALSSSETKEIARDLLLAETAASQGLSLALDSPNPASNPWFQSLPAELIPPNRKAWFENQNCGESWFTCGLVHTALGEYLFAAGDMERAQEVHPGGEQVEEVFSKVRGLIDWNVKPGTGMKKAVKLAGR